MTNIQIKDLAGNGLFLNEAKLANTDISRSSKQESYKTEISGLKNVADQFEAIFLETLLRQARESKLSDGLFDSKADDNFEQMFDQELANSSSKMVDIGIADAIIRQMSKTRI